MSATGEIPPDSMGRPSEAQIVAASKIQLLGLESIKTRLGKKWDRMSGLVHRYFDAAIRKALRPGDTFCHYGDMSYLVLFRELSVADAQFKCAMVVEDVCRKLFGEEGEDLSMRSVIAPVDASELNDAKEQARLNEALEREGIETIFSNKGSADPSGDQREIRVHMGPASGPAHRISLQKTSFVYRPLWDTSRNVVLTYLCQVLPLTFVAATSVSSLATAIDEDNAQAVLDVLTLQECLRRMANLHRAGLRVLLAAPCHFSTLSRTSQWARYRSCLVSASPELLRNIAFFVHGFDAGVPHIRLAQELPKLSAYSKFLFCLVDGMEGPVARFRNTGVHALGLSYEPGAVERRWIEGLDAVARPARAAGMDTFVLGVAKRSVAVNAIGAGARYVEGKSIRPMVADPRNAFVQDIEDLYRTGTGGAR